MSSFRADPGESRGETRNPAARESANLSRTQLETSVREQIAFGAAGFRVSGPLRDPAPGMTTGRTPPARQSRPPNRLISLHPPSNPHPLPTTPPAREILRIFTQPRSLTVAPTPRRPGPGFQTIQTIQTRFLSGEESEMLSPQISPPSGELALAYIRRGIRPAR